MDLNLMELLNNTFGSDFVSSAISILQSLVLVLVSYFSTKIKSKVTDVAKKYDNDLANLREKFNVTDEHLDKATEKLDALSSETINASAVMNVLVEVVGLLALESKSIPSNTKLTVSKLLGSLGNNQEAVQHVEQVVAESKQIESVPVEQIEQEKKDIEDTAKASNEIIQGIAEQTIDVYNEIINE